MKLYTAVNALILKKRGNLLFERESETLQSQQENRNKTTTWPFSFYIFLQDNDGVYGDVDNVVIVTLNVP